jgi:hypothetical protein
MNRYRRRAARFAVLLTALAAVLALLIPPAATAAPAPAAKPNLPIIIVPKGVTHPDADQAKAFAQQVFGDAIGRAGAMERRALVGGDVDNGAKNTSVMWFDFSDWSQADLPDAATIAEMSTKGLVTVDATHKFYVEWLQYAGNEALFVRLGKAPGARILKFSATNVGKADVPVKALGQHGVHAEDWILRQMRAALRILFPRIKRAQLEAILEAAAAAVYSDRQNCAAICSPQTKMFPADKNVSVVRWGTAAERGAARRVLAEIMREVRTLLNKMERSGQQAAQAAAGCPPAEAPAPAPQETAPGQPAPGQPAPGQPAPGQPAPGQPAPGPPAVGLGPGGFGGGRALGLAAPVLRASSCAPAKKGSGSPATSPLGQLLAQPVPMDKYGGVDFSTLELRYISDSDDGVQFSYSADSLGAGYRQDQALGARVVQMTAADLRTWLVLDPTKFWVNLDPQEPDRIIDAQLGKTNAGRSMLEADLAMKRTSGRLINPRTPFGKRYWNAMTAGSTGTVCFSSRVWIVPGEIRVREEGSSLYVLKAGLDVKTESELGRGLGAECPPVDPATDERRERVERELVLPEIVKAVNTAPEYAPLRRAFMARVVAQWIRQRHDAGRRTSYDDIIGSGRLGPAELRDGWKPRRVYDDFLKSWKTKEFSYSITSRQGDQVLVSQFTFGGVDWSNLRYDGVSEGEMKAGYAHLADTVRTSAGRMATAPDGSIWLGATTPGPERSAWDRAIGRVDGLTDGRLGVALIIAVALVALAFGFRGPRRRPAERPPATSG